MQISRWLCKWHSRCQHVDVYVSSSFVCDHTVRKCAIVFLVGVQRLVCDCENEADDELNLLITAGQ